MRPLTARRRHASAQGLCGCLEARTDAQGPRSATGRLRDCRRVDVARRSGSCRQPRRRSRTTLSAPTVLALLRKLWRRRACAERRRWPEQVLELLPFCSVPLQLPPSALASHAGRQWPPLTPPLRRRRRRAARRRAGRLHSRQVLLCSSSPPPRCRRRLLPTSWRRRKSRASPQGAGCRRTEAGHAAV